MENQQNQLTTYKIQNQAGCYEEINPENFLIWQTNNFVTGSLGNTKFSNYNFSYYSKTENELMIKIAEELRKWDFKTPIGISIISKQNGIGKTGMAICLYKKFVYEFYKKNYENNIRYYYKDIRENEWDCPELIKPSHLQFLSAKKLDLEIRMSYNDKYGEKEDEILNRYSSKHFLIIDDIFSSTDNDFSRRNLLYILDERLEWKNLPTVITSNYDFESLQKIDTRIASRMNFKDGFFEIQTKQKDLRSL